MPYIGSCDRKCDGGGFKSQFGEINYFHFPALVVIVHYVLSAHPVIVH